MSEVRKDWSGMDAETPTNPVDMYKDTLRKIDEILKYRNDLNMVFGPSLSKVENAYRIARIHLNVLITDKPTKVEPHEVSQITEAVDILSSIAVERELPKIYLDLAKLLIDIFNNLNSQAIGDKHLTGKLLMLNKIINAKLTMDDTIVVLRMLLDKLRQYKHTEPAALGLSKHYLKSLEARDCETTKDNDAVVK